jgi:hypothetical protein
MLSSSELNITDTGRIRERSGYERREDEAYL